mgnify:CR=1 FL=1
MALIARVDYHKWVPLAIPAYVTSIILSVAVIFFGDEYNGSKRWLSLGPISFQPSEFAKVAVIFFLACLVSRNVQRMKRFRTMILMMIPVLPIVGLVGASNLSTAIIILGIAVVLIFVADPKYVRFILMGSIGVGFMTVFLAMESYRLERLAIWRHPEQYEKGYQTLQGLYAIGSGGLFGRGLGNSVQKLGFLPEAQNDMIFSIICEELGLIGAGFIISFIFDSYLAFFCDFNKSVGSAWRFDSGRGNGAYDDPGYIKHRGSYKFNSKHRDYASVYQLRRYIGCISSVGDGTCA